MKRDRIPIHRIGEAEPIGYALGAVEKLDRATRAVTRAQTLLDDTTMGNINDITESEMSDLNIGYDRIFESDLTNKQKLQTDLKEWIDKLTVKELWKFEHLVHWFYEHEGK